MTDVKQINSYLPSQLIHQLSNLFAPKLLTGVKLPNAKEVRDGTMFILKSDANKSLYIMHEGEWELFSSPSALSVLSATASEIEFGFGDTSKVIYSNGVTPLRLIQILVDVTTAFTSGARMKISTPTKTLLYDSEVILTQALVKPKFLNYIITAGDRLTLTITGEPIAGEGKILLITGAL